MSNLERDPAELLCEHIDAALGAEVEILEPRLVPLGGPRAMAVRRTLPQRARSTIGAWCFLDHYGPDDVSLTGGMEVPPHPHTALQTASWLFEGEIEHRDSVGTHAIVRPGELNLMTAGHGISHSEVSTAETTVLHGVQLWVALPGADRGVAPFFERSDAIRIEHEGALIRVFAGELHGAHAPTATFSPLLGAQIDLEPGAHLELEMDEQFEHGVLVDSGSITLCGSPVARYELGYLAPGRSRIGVTAGPEGARVVLLGGTPYGEQLVMWWNFIGGDHDAVATARADWQADVIDGGDPGGRFGHVADYPGAALPAPVLPNVRLRPRD